jgi:hypothetical protein
MACFSPVLALPISLFWLRRAHFPEGAVSFAMTRRPASGSRGVQTGDSPGRPTAICSDFLAERHFSGKAGRAIFDRKPRPQRKYRVGCDGVETLLALSSPRRGRGLQPAGLFVNARSVSAAPAAMAAPAVMPVSIASPAIMAAPAVMPWPAASPTVVTPGARVGSVASPAIMAPGASVVSVTSPAVMAPGASVASVASPAVMTTSGAVMATSVATSIVTSVIVTDPDDRDGAQAVACRGRKQTGRRSRSLRGEGRGQK